MKILVGNVGSTSVKTKLITYDDRGISEISGEADLSNIHDTTPSTFKSLVGKTHATDRLVNIQGLSQAISYLLDWYTEVKLIQSNNGITAMGFKCVMGETNGANLLTREILAEMKMYGFVAPAHNLPYLEAIDEFRKVIDVPMVGVFEPSFHYTLPDFRKELGLPPQWKKIGIRKLGFHGASHRYLSARAYQLLGNELGKVITVHLGGSSSICAILDGKSVDIDQHFSPNSGLLQGTRVGDTDATAVLFAMDKLKLSVGETQEMLSHSSGLKAMAGLGTDDVKTIETAAQAGNKQAKIALDFYTDGIRKHIAASASVLGGIDMVIFSGGTGQHSAYIRERCLNHMEFMGIEIDLTKNQLVMNEGMISDPAKSKVKVWVVPTNEEIVVGHFTRLVVEKGRDMLPEEMVFKLH